MGSLQAEEFAGMVREGSVVLDAALHWHLRSNHFPPLPLALIEVAKAAIQKANNEEYEAEIDMPDGISFRDAGKATVYQLIESMHLESFIDG